MKMAHPGWCLEIWTNISDIVFSKVRKRPAWLIGECEIEIIITSALVNYNTNETTTKPKSAGLQAI
jgi:hypothetical protein